MSLFHRTATAAVLGVLAITTLTGCGGSSSAGTTGAAAGGYPNARSSGAPGGFTMDQAQLKKIRTCLKAAGISADLPTGRPSGLPSNGPSGAPSNFPSDGTGTPPTGGPSGFPSGGAGGAFQDPQVQAALEACGISLPTRPSGAPSQ